MKCKAGVIHGVGEDWKVDEIEVDPPKAGEVLVQWTHAGMCHSDEHLVTGDMVPTPEMMALMGTDRFFPVVGGTAREAFDWRGSRIAVGDWVMLDLWATNHDPRSWDEPDRFDPERFDGWNGDPDTLIPQGAGLLLDDHRCPGEGAAITIMGEFTRSFVDGDIAVPSQDLGVDLRRFPALPEDRMRVAFPA